MYWNILRVPVTFFWIDRTDTWDVLKFGSEHVIIIFLHNRTDTWDVLKCFHFNGDVDRGGLNRTDTWDVLKFPYIPSVVREAGIEPTHEMYWNNRKCVMLALLVNRTDTWDVLKSTPPVSYVGNVTSNRHMRCIEIRLGLLRNVRTCTSNRHMRCIEICGSFLSRGRTDTHRTDTWDVLKFNPKEVIGQVRVSNRHMRCIEI